ncbi:MAG: DUF4214 domain-containing protein [Acidimicrobiales bacterium]
MDGAPPGRCIASDSIADAFGESEEFTATYGPLDDAAFVDLAVYRNVLDRSADTAGAAFWRGQLASRSRSGDACFSELVEFAVQLGHLILQ